MTKITFRVPDMHCSACVMRLEGLEDELGGIQRIRASFHRQEMSVDFDENIINEGQIIVAIEAKGYHPVRLE